MKNQTSTKVLSGLMAGAIFLSSLFIGIPLFASADAPDVSGGLAAAKEYVETERNDVTPAGLLAAMNSGLPEGTTATLTYTGANFADDVDGGIHGDFFIKHAVPGVLDDDTTSGYPLNIPGSDGAVAAVFEVDGVRVGFSAAFAHEVETIRIDPEKIAVATFENSDFTKGHTGNGSPTIAGYTGNAEKIIIPAGFDGRWALSQALPATVKVIIIGGGSDYLSEPAPGRDHGFGFQGSTGLIAFAFTDDFDNEPKSLFEDDTHAFKGCTALKYIKLPATFRMDNYGGYSKGFSTDTFSGCTSLENFNLPNFNTAPADDSGLGHRTFEGTAIRDFLLPVPNDKLEDGGPAVKYLVGGPNNTFKDPGLTTGTRNIIDSSKSMEFLRAAALAAAKANELFRAGGSSDAAIIAAARAAVVGSMDAAAYRETLTITMGDQSLAGDDIRKALTIADGTDSVTVSLAKANKTLQSLSVTGQSLSPAYDPDVLVYSLTVGSSVTSLTVNAAAVTGATLGAITGQTDLAIGLNTISVPVTPPGETIPVTYTIKVIRLNIDPGLEAGLTAAKTYVETEKNDVTPAGLLTAMNSGLPEGITATLDYSGNNIADKAEEGITGDFYIKHAVPGVVDNDTTSGYPLSIPGSDGAVTAVFEVDGERVGFSAVFAHEVETITLDPAKILLVDPDIKTQGFELGANGQGHHLLKAYTGTAEKIIIPSGCNARWALAAPLPATVKVIIMAGSQYYLCEPGALGGSVGYGLQDSTGLIAFACTTAADIEPQCVFENYTPAFKGCTALKYVRLPATSKAPGYTGADRSISASAFEGCTSLENIVLPQISDESTGGMGNSAFKGTAVRDFVLPETKKKVTHEDGDPTYEDGGPTVTYVQSGASATFGAPNLSDGTRNILDSKKPMTFVRAAALAAAKANELFRAGGSSDTAIVAAAKEAVVGSTDAATYRDTLTINMGDQSLSGDDIRKALTMTDGTNSVTVWLAKTNKTLRSLSVTGQSIEPAFDPDVFVYSLTVENSVSSLSVNAVAVTGATLGAITGQSLTVGVNTIKVPVTPAGETAPVIYTIKVTRLGSGGSMDDAKAALAAAAAAYKAGNSATREEFESYLQDGVAATGYELTLTDFYRYRAIDGAKDNNGPLVEGHKGTITAIAKLTKDAQSVSVPLKLTIEPVMEAYEFAEGEVSDPNDFVLSDGGKFLERYSGDAKKVVIPEGVEEMADTWYDGYHPEEVIALVLPKSLKTTPTRMCYAMYKLEVVRMEDNVTMMGASAFKNCCMLQYVRLSENLTNIAQEAFYNVIALTGLYIPESVTKFTDYAFYQCGIFDFTIPKNVKSVGLSCICYKSRMFSATQVPELSEESGQKLQEIMKDKKHATTPRTITVLNPDLQISSSNAFDGESAINLAEENGGWIYLRMPRSDSLVQWYGETPVDGSFCNLHIDWDFTMTLAEAAARAQQKADTVFLTKDSTAADALEAIQSAYTSKSVGAPTWKEAFKFTPETGICSGVLQVSADGVSYDVVINKAVAQAVVRPEPEPEPEPTVSEKNPLSVAEGSKIAKLDGKTLLVLKGTTIEKLLKELVIDDEYYIDFYDEDGGYISEGDYAGYVMKTGDIMKLFRTANNELYSTYTIRVVGSITNPGTGEPTAANVALLFVTAASIGVIAAVRKKRIRE